MGKDKHVIWTNDSSTRESEEKYIKGDWINEVRAKLGLGDSNETWVPSSLVGAVKEAAIDAAIEKAVGRDEKTINFVEAYREFAQKENIENIIDERFYDELDERVYEDNSDWRDCEVANLSGIDIHKSIPLIKDGDDGYCFLDEYKPYQIIGAINDAGDLIEALYKKMNGDTIELSIKDGELTVSESVGYVGAMEDHIVKLVDANFVNEIENLSGDEVDKLYSENGFSTKTAISDVIVALAEKQGHLQDIVPAICEVYGWAVGNAESQEAGESLDEICDAKSAEAEFEHEDCGDVLGEQERG